MNKTIMKRITALLLAAAIVAGIWVAMPSDRDSYAGETVIATPTIQKMKFWANSFSRDENGVMTSGATKPEIAQRFVYNGVTVDWDRNTDMSQYIPVYSIIQPNGYGANYVKLRDVAALVNFNVQWSFANPNAMYIWTNNHYAEEPKLSGPATETKVGEWSTYDIYVDGVKVEGLQPVLIDDNNYFKIRDIAKMVNFGCMYNVYTEEVSVVGISEYVDEAILNAMPVNNKNFLINEWIEASPERNIIFQNVRPTYGYPSGTVSTTPVTLTENDPWARENYFDKYASQELKDNLGYNPASTSSEEIELERTIIAEFNAMVQRLVDKDIANRENYVAPRFEEHEALYTDFRETNPHPYNCSLPNMEGIKESLKKYTCDSERIKYLAALVCDKSEYHNPDKVLDPAHNNKTVRELVAEAGHEMYPSWESQYSALLTQGGEFFTNTDTLAFGSCGYYAGRFYALAKSAGYYTVSTTGWSNGAAHAWNYVWLPDEAKWVGVDCTNADPYSSVVGGIRDGVQQVWYNDKTSMEFFFKEGFSFDESIGFGVDDYTYCRRWTFEENSASWLSTELSLSIMMAAYAEKSSEYYVPEYVYWDSTSISTTEE